MTVTIQKPRSSNYTEHEIKRGLTVLALCSGNKRRASAELATQGFEVPANTLYTWRTKHAAHYKRICDEEIPKVYAQIAEECEDLALAQADVERQLLTRLVVDMPNMDVRDVSTALRNVGVAKAVNIDKATLTRGRPTTITEDRTLVEVARNLSRFAGVIEVNTDAIDSTAEEIT